MKRLAVSLGRGGTWGKCSEVECVEKRPGKNVSTAKVSLRSGPAITRATTDILSKKSRNLARDTEDKFWGFDFDADDG